jgi:hypothetical protein
MLQKNYETLMTVLSARYAKNEANGLNHNLNPYPLRHSGIL